MIKLRDYQENCAAKINEAWAGGARNVLLQSATGSGKTVLFSHVITKEPDYSCAIAHRQEIVGQISLALARNNVSHRIIGAEKTVRMIQGVHCRELGRSYVDPHSRVFVAGVDTLIKLPPSTPWLSRVKLMVQDEAHHLLKRNKWGKAAAMFPNARGLLVTATPIRADGYGLGAWADGIADVMIEAPGMRELIRRGYLTDYRIFSHPSDVDYSDVPIAAGGDLSLPALRAAVHRSGTIVGDVVQTYLRKTPGKLGITFAVDIEHATEMAAAFRQQGVPSQVVTSKTHDAARSLIMRQFAAGEIKQLVNVDLFGEGFDLPALEVVSMVRKTESFSLFSQMFGRVLRIMDSKEYGIVHDHVGNTIRHGLPDAPRDWSIGLDRRERRSRSKVSDSIPMRQCLNVECLAPYERIHRACPYCGTYPEPPGRSTPDQVDGDLSELTPEVLAALRGEITASEELRLPYGARPEILWHLRKVHHERTVEQGLLRAQIALWGGWQTSLGHSVSEAQRRFFFAFGVDVASAQMLKRAEAEELRGRIEGYLSKQGIQEKLV